jgi:hypothetical protein
MMNLLTVLLALLVTSCGASRPSVDIADSGKKLATTDGESNGSSSIAGAGEADPDGEKSTNSGTRGQLDGVNEEVEGSGGAAQASSLTACKYFKEGQDIIPGVHPLNIPFPLHKKFAGEFTEKDTVYIATVVVGFWIDTAQTPAQCTANPNLPTCDGKPYKVKTKDETLSDRYELQFFEVKVNNIKSKNCDAEGKRLVK